MFRTSGLAPSDAYAKREIDSLLQRSLRDPSVLKTEWLSFAGIYDYNIALKILSSKDTYLPILSIALEMGISFHEAIHAVKSPDNYHYRPVPRMSWKVVQTLVEYGYSIEEADKSMLDFSKCIEAMHCQRQDVVSMLDLCFHYGYNWERIAEINSTEKGTFNGLLPSNVPTSLSFAYAFASVGRTSDGNVVYVRDFLFARSVTTDYALNYRSSHGKNLLMLALQYNVNQVIEMIFEESTHEQLLSMVNHVAHNGSTALHCATEWLNTSNKSIYQKRVKDIRALKFSPDVIAQLEAAEEAVKARELRKQYVHSRY